MISEKDLNKEVKRIWILGDMHLGVRANSMEWLDIQKDYYENEFIPLLKKNVKPGDILIQVGDTFDNRQSINIKVMHYAIQLFETLGNILPTHVICGNHDIWAKNSNEITSIDALKWIPGIAVYKEPKVFKWSGKNCLLMPWRVDANHEIETLSKFPNNDLLFCHSEVRGAWLNAKVQNHHGVDISVYKSFESVYSGHIHFRQNKGKLKLVGTPYELTRSDMNNEKGVLCLDLETSTETFFPNTRSPRFVKFELINLFNTRLIEFKDLIRNNFVDLLIPTSIASSTQLSQLLGMVQDVSRKIEPHIYDENDYQIEEIDSKELEDAYKNYNILNLCNMYVENNLASQTPEMQERVKEKLKGLYSQNNLDI